MRVIFIFLLALVTTAQAQQINPVPDYIFRNQMSVGRNGVTDTAAYMSVGPRFGAVKGFMPPMVTDTNSVTGVKRNGLLIFSLQLNNFAYWDSTTARFRKITAEATVDSLIYATRAWRKKGDDSLGAIIAVKTDTGLLSTKAYRQKGIDSVVTLISTLGGGTVLSVSAGTGMNFSTITTAGAVNADTAILSTRAWRKKGDDSLGAIVGTKVNISDTATMLGAYLRKADTTAMIAPYLRKVDTTAMLGNYVRAAGFGLVKSTYTLSADTAAMATRARVQKGIDSVSALFTSPDTLTLSTRAWRQKGDDSLGAIIGTKATATGTTNYLSKFTGTSALGNSIVYATTSEVGISTPSPTHTLDVNGRVRVRTIDSTATGINLLYADADGVIKKTALSASTGGTVTSVATGYGLSGGTITTTGTLIADTLNLSTKAWRQKGIDSVASVRVGGTGTTNYVPKFTGTSTIGDGQIVDNAASGVNVGAKLLLRDDGPFITGANIAGITGNFAVGTSTASSLQLHTNSTNRLHINSAGSVGIGNTSPAYLLDVSGTLRNTTGAAFATSSGNVLVGTVTDAGYKLDVAGTLRNTTGANFATSSGNVGIGTTSPATKLDVSGAITLNDGLSSGFIDFKRGSNVLSRRYRLLTDANNVGDFGIRLFDSANTTATTPFLIRSTGFVGISNVAPSYNLDITGTLRNTTDAAFATSSGNVLIGTTVSRAKLSIAGIETNTPSLGTASGAAIFTNNVAMNYGLNIGVSGTGDSWLQAHRFDATATAYNLQLQPVGGNVGIGNTAPSEKLHVTGRIRATTIDSTATAMNMLYADATGVIKKAAVPSGGSGSVTSVATGFGLSGGTITTTGTLIVDSASVATRARVQKGIDSVASLTTAKVGGTGITGYFPKWTGTSTQDTSQLFQLGANIGIGTASPTYRIHLPDAGNTANQAMLAGSVFGSDGNGQTVAPSSGAMAYYGQGSDGYLYGAQSSGGKWGVNTRSVSDAVFNVNGDVKIVTIDSTSTARNMLYQDANGVIKKSAALTMSDDVMTASGSWVVTKDAGSGFSINNVAYTTNGTTKMVTIDGNFYIPEASWTNNTWIAVATIPSGYRPAKTINWDNKFIISGAEYERADNTDFTGGLEWLHAQMRVKDTGALEVYADIKGSNSIAAGGTAYIIVTFTQSYIIK